MQKLAQSIAQLLDSQRLAYRSFGPYWWPVKHLLRTHGFAKMLGLSGRKNDDPRAVRWFHGIAIKDLLSAALEYHQAHMTRGSALEVQHSTPDGDEPYHLHDSDME